MFAASLAASLNITIELRGKDAMAAGSRVPFDDVGADYPLVISPKELADILSLSIKTIYAWIAAGRLKGCIRKRGKHILIYRPCAIERIFAGPEWR